MALAPNAQQTAEKSILDLNGKQTYLGNQFVYAIPSTAISGTSEIPLALFLNAAANTKTLFLSYRKMNCLTSGQSMVLNFYSNPTITGNGTPVTPVNLRTASLEESDMTVGSSPTVSANGTLIGSMSALAFSPDHSSTLIISDPGQSIFVTVTPSQTNARISAEFVWYEL